MESSPRTLALAALALVLALGAAACEARPARFADRPPVWNAGDDAPSPVPRRTGAPSTKQLFDAHLERAVLASLEPRRIPDAGDVNAFDEVPRSSWFCGDGLLPETASPVLPFDRIPEPPASGRGGISVADARGARWEIRMEGELEAASEVLANDLLRELGYRAPEVRAIDLAPGDVGGAPEMAGRATAMAWPPGIELGPTPLSATRPGDPNDRVAHRDRRTLRGLRDVFAWFRLPRLDAAMLRDVYVGAPGRGHVEHFVLGRTGELWGTASAPAEDDREMGRPYRSLVLEILSLGLAPPVLPYASGPEIVTLADFEPRPPWEPLERVLPADAFWIARRMMAIPLARLRALVARTALAPRARDELVEVLDLRRRTIAARAYGVVTACTVVALEAKPNAPPDIVIFDEAIASGFVSSADTRYVVEVLDDDGGAIAPATLVDPTGANVRARVSIPAGAFDRVIVRVTAERGERRAPRPLEVHLVGGAKGPRVIAVRH